MTEETTPPEGDKPEEKEDDQRVPYDRFQKVNQKAKEAADRAAKAEKDLAEIRSQLEEREQQGLPELEQMKKRLDQAEKARQDAESKAEKLEAETVKATRKGWIAAAAQEQNFIYPSAVANLDEVDLSQVESEEDAARVVKKVAKKYPKLIADEEPMLPGKVLSGGQRQERPAPKGAIDSEAEAETVAEGLRQFLKSRESSRVGGL
jgi:DNA repair exonuclease SbcCD ATPase subunit